MLLMTNAAALDLEALCDPGGDLNALAARMRLTRCHFDRGVREIANLHEDEFEGARRQLGLRRARFERVYRAATSIMTPPLQGLG